MNKTWKAVLGVILIFIFGWISGAISTSVFVRHRLVTALEGGPQAVASLLERRLTRNLDLDSDQQKKVHDAFVENMTQRWALQKNIQPQIQMLNHATMQEVSAVLRPDQLEKFRANLALMRKRSGRNVFANVPEDESPGPAVGSPPGK